MARTKAKLGAGARLVDYLRASLLARVYPVALVQEVLPEHACQNQRVRLFSATAGVYYCMALSLYPEAAYESVFAAVKDGLAWMQGEATGHHVAEASISRCAARSAIPRSRNCIDVRACPGLICLATGRKPRQQRTPPF